MTTVWINGQGQDHLKLPHRGLAYGDGIFETLRIQHNRAPLLSAHLKRLAHSAHTLGFGTGFNIQSIEAQVLSVLSSGHNHCGVLKILVLRHHQGRGYAFVDGTPDVIVEFYPADLLPFGWELPPLQVGRCDSVVSVNRQLAGHKHLNRIDSVLAAAEVRAQQWDDGFRFVGDQLVEATSANVFTVKGNCLKTPEIDLAGVKGVAREHILALAPAHFDAVVVGEITESDVCEAEAVFVSNAVILLRQVGSFTLGTQRVEYTQQPPGLLQLINSLREEMSR